MQPGSTLCLAYQLTFNSSDTWLTLTFKLDPRIIKMAVNTLESLKEELKKIGPFTIVFIA